MVSDSQFEQSSKLIHYQRMHADTYELYHKAVFQILSFEVCSFSNFACIENCTTRNSLSFLLTQGNSQYISNKVKFINNQMIKLNQTLRGFDAIHVYILYIMLLRMICINIIHPFFPFLFLCSSSFSRRAPYLFILKSQLKLNPLVLSRDQKLPCENDIENLKNNYI